MTTGLVIGKFYPPHRGHRHLIESAKAQVDALTAIVCHRHDQQISGELRATWLREMVPGVRVLVVPDTLPEADSRAWAAYTLQILGRAPDVVFTSEEYGEAYARFLGSRHVMVDRQRRSVPVSGTAIRRSPLSHWGFLDPCVRAHYAVRVCVVGAESTGTTTLARALAVHYRTAWVPEFGRSYAETKLACEATGWETREFVFIARQQNELEDQLARVCNRILVCDTDSFATSVWHERYLGFRSAEVDALSEGRRHALTLLTDADIPFVQDGTRDGEHLREAMHRRFAERLAQRGLPWLLVRGDPEARLRAAIAACDRLLSEMPSA